MSLVNIQSGNQAINLYYEDWGKGVPVVLIHGWPLSHEMWEHQLINLPAQGVRCIAYDRRGFGKSDKPWSGYDYDTLASDLNGLLTKLDITNATLVGFSMGGGEVARYLSRYGSDRVSKAILISSVTPLLLKGQKNPEGVPKEEFDKMITAIEDDRASFLTGFGKQFYGQGYVAKPVSEELLQWNAQLALRASPKATLDCVRSFSETDFTQDLAKITIPTLIIHGDADKTVPFDITGRVAAKMISGAKTHVYRGAPHGLFETEKDRLTKDILEFVRD